MTLVLMVPVWLLQFLASHPWSRQEEGRRVKGSSVLLLLSFFLSQENKLFQKSHSADFVPCWARKGDEKDKIVDEDEKQQYLLCWRNRTTQFYERTVQTCVAALVVGLRRKRGYGSHLDRFVSPENVTEASRYTLRQSLGFFTLVSKYLANSRNRNDLMDSGHVSLLPLK